ncbi:hypothetical protein [Streptomyces apocyni]|uniref:hypothetical protein n=1 Tax=Streptomyces apocyni TaxID=2654677 RepID=UPI0012E9D171|nr:hypothetical protein [Streptomyces apocyni]
MTAAPAAEPTPEPTPEQLLDRALVEEATKKSSLIWVRGAGRERALWHVWHDGAAHLVGDGPGEQPLPDIAGGTAVTVTVRSKDKGGRIVSWTARAAELAPRSAEWDAAVAELQGKRLNAVDSDQLTERWARDCRVLRLEPDAISTDLPSDSLAIPPMATPATTREPAPAALPRLLRRGHAKRA